MEAGSTLRGFAEVPDALRVLLVDSGGSRAHNLGLLSDCGYEVTAVRTAKEAVHALENGTFDIALKNHDPATGVNACRFLRKATGLPVVVMSDADERQEVFKCLNLGAADYLVKPLRLQELRNIWTRVWWHQAIHSPGGPPAPILAPIAAPGGVAVSVSGGDETKTEEGDEPTSKVGSAPPGGVVAGFRGARSSANRNSTTKPGGGGRLPGGNGSNTANGYGSNAGNGASTTHVYASHGGSRGCDDGNAPLVYRTMDGSGGGSGGGSVGSRGNGNGSGQGSGSGNAELAAGRRLPSDSPELRAQLEAASGKASGCLPPGAGGGLDPNAQRVATGGSNGNSGVSNMEGEAVAAAKRETALKRESADNAAALRGTAQGKHVALQAPPAGAAAAPGCSPRHGGHQSPKSAAAAVAATQADPGAAAPAAVGFRAWVSPPSAQKDGSLARGSLKRSASSLARRGSLGAGSLGNTASLPLPLGRGAKASKGHAAASPATALTPRDRFDSTGTGTATGASDGTHFGNSGTLGANAALLRNGSVAGPKASAAAVSSSMPPPPPSASQQLPQLPPVVTSQQAQVPAAAAQQPASPSAWGASDTAALQQMQATAAQQQAAQQQMSMQLRVAYSGNSSFQYGGMPPHMVPPNFAPSPIALWGGYAAAAQQQAQQQQQQQQQAQAQQRQAQQQQAQQQQVQAQQQQQQAQAQQKAQQAQQQQAQAQQAQQQHATSSAQQPYAYTPQQAQAMQQQAQMQQAMMGYPSYLMNSFMGGFPSLQTSWAQMQQAHAQQQAQQQQQAQAQQQQQQQQQTGTATLPPRPPAHPQAQKGSVAADLNRMRSLAAEASGASVRYGGASNTGGASNFGAAASILAANDVGGNGSAEGQNGNNNGGLSRAPTLPGVARVPTPTTVVAESNAVPMDGGGGTNGGLEDDGCGGHVPTQKERRQQALTKYKQKRKNLCFTKKIRYESRKQLAQARPRVKGQFVRITSTDVELLDGAEPPASPSALAAAIEAGTVRVICLDSAAGTCASAPAATDDTAQSDNDDVNSPRAIAAIEALAPMPRQTWSQTSGSKTRSGGKVGSGSSLERGCRAAVKTAA